MQQAAVGGIARLAEAARRRCFITPDETVQAQVDHIVNTYTGLVSAGKEKFQADPFVIALAKVTATR